MPYMMQVEVTMPVMLEVEAGSPEEAIERASQMVSDALQQIERHAYFVGTVDHDRVKKRVVPAH
jgi:SOS-response transcriptional repressor LexA